MQAMTFFFQATKSRRPVTFGKHLLQQTQTIRLRLFRGYLRIKMDITNHRNQLSFKTKPVIHLTPQARSPRYPQELSLCELDMLVRLTTADGRPVTVMATTGGNQPDRQEVTVRGSRLNYQFREYSQLWRSEGGAWTEAIDWTHEDPHTSALQRQLSEVDRSLKGQPHKLATAQEALAVQVLIEAMLK
jgi:hypothetical protein